MRPSFELMCVSRVRETVFVPWIAVGQRFDQPGVEQIASEIGKRLPRGYVACSTLDRRFGEQSSCLDGIAAEVFTQESVERFVTNPTLSDDRFCHPRTKSAIDVERRRAMASGGIGFGHSNLL